MGRAWLCVCVAPHVCNVSMQYFFLYYILYLLCLDMWWCVWALFYKGLRYSLYEYITHDMMSPELYAYEMFVSTISFGSHIPTCIIYINFKYLCLCPHQCHFAQFSDSTLLCYMDLKPLAKSFIYRMTTPFFHYLTAFTPNRYGNS